MDDQFYAKKTITYQLGKNHILYSLFEKAKKNNKRNTSSEEDEIEETDSENKNKRHKLE